MRVYTQPHRFYCGIDLHARTLFLHVLDHDGQTRVEKNIPARPDNFLEAVKPFRDGLVVGVECMFAWYWLADLCAAEGIAFVLGHALYMKMIHGGKAKSDKIDAAKIAGLLCGGLFPQAYVYPRVPRALSLRRRRYTPQPRVAASAHPGTPSSEFALRRRRCITRISPKRSARHIRCRTSPTTAETHPETILSGDVLPDWQCTSAIVRHATD